MKIFGPKTLIDQIRSAPALALFLDYDGTLADFAQTPDDIHPDNVLIDLLQRLAASPRIQPAIISGRRLGHIQKLVPLKGLWLAGTYGIELQSPDGGVFHRIDLESVRPLLDRLKPLWLALLTDQSGFYLEDKGWSLALHGKDAEKQSGVVVFNRASEIVREIVPENGVFRVMGGNRFLEVAPSLANKGRTIKYLLDQAFDPGDLPVYLGDDDKDEEAFEVIVKCQGIAIKVSKNEIPSHAQLRLKDPAAVRDFLFTLLNDQH